MTLICIHLHIYPSNIVLLFECCFYTVPHNNDDAMIIYFDHFSTKTVHPPIFIVQKYNAIELLLYTL
jgi:hypothetical protein